MKLPTKRVPLLLIIGVVLACSVVGYLALHVSDRRIIKDISAPTSTAGTPTMQFEIADTAAKQELGLGRRSSIPNNYGMLFVFGHDDRYGFWMKDMLVPIDITWLSDNGTVLLIDHDVQIDTYPNVFFPPAPVKYVLETRAGYAKDYGWEVGTRIPLPVPYGR